MPELSDEGAEMIYRNTCVELYFKSWIFLLKKIIYIDNLRILRECPWEATVTYDALNNDKKVYVAPVLDLMQNRFNWPCFVTDDNFRDVFFQLKYLWEVHCNNKFFEIYRIGPGNLGIRSREILSKTSKKPKAISLNNHRDSFWMVFQDLDFEDVLDRRNYISC